MSLTPGRLYLASEVADPLYHLAAKGSVGDTVVVSENPFVRPHSCFFLPPEAATSPGDATRSKVEHIFEFVRESLFSTLPSRKRCHFASPSVDAANYWRSKPHRSDWPLFKVCPEPGARVVAVDVRFFDYAVQVLDGRWLSDHETYAYGSDSSGVEVAKVAGFYWHGEQAPAAVTQIEVLVEGAWTLAEGPL